MPSVIPCILDGQTYFIENQKDIINPSWGSLDLRGLELAIILEIEPPKVHDGQWSFNGSRAAFVSISERDEETLIAKHIGVITVLNKGGSHQKMRRAPWSEAQEKDAARTPCEAEFFDAEQDWYFL